MWHIFLGVTRTVGNTSWKLPNNARDSGRSRLVDGRAGVGRGLFLDLESTRTKTRKKGSQVGGWVGKEGKVMGTAPDRQRWRMRAERTGV